MSGNGVILPWSKISELEQELARLKAENERLRVRAALLDRGVEMMHERIRELEAALRKIETRCRLNVPTIAAIAAAALENA